jgi:putative lipoprotein (rSAM/lipoprotein system)
MKRIKKAVFKAANAVISVLLFILGFSVFSCQKDDNYEYGTLTTVFEFLITGTVTDETTNQPIPNIKVRTDQDSTVTDSAGGYITIYYGFSLGDTIQVQFIDVDGQANGEFQQLDKGVDFSDAEFSGGNGKWFLGGTVKKVNVELKEKE